MDRPIQQGVNALMSRDRKAKGNGDRTRSRLDRRTVRMAVEGVVGMAGGLVIGFAGYDHLLDAKVTTNQVLEDPGATERAREHALTQEDSAFQLGTEGVALGGLVVGAGLFRFAEAESAYKKGKQPDASGGPPDPEPPSRPTGDSGPPGNV